MAQGAQQYAFGVLARRTIFWRWLSQVQHMLRSGRGQAQFFQHILR
jgi:hypothetical protein